MMFALKGKRKNLFKTLAASAAALFLLFAAGCGGGYELFSPQKLVLNTADEYALKGYGYEELSDVRTTLRADTMNVTKRNLKRPVPKLLSDVYTLSAATVSGESYSRSIEFTKYPSPSTGIKAEDFTDAALKEGRAQGINVDTAEGRQQAITKYFYYYKYMMLSQSTALLAKSQKDSESGVMSQETLFKHPAADSQYGEVKGSDNAVEKEITLDPLYRSQHVTGLYLPAGEAVTVKIEGLKKGEKISVAVALNGSMGWRGAVSSQPVKDALTFLGAEAESAKGDYFTCADIIAAGGKFYDTFELNDKGELRSPLVSSQWARQNNRMPRLNMSFTFDKDGEYVIGSPFGGIIHITPNNCYSPVKTTFTGAVETPHYILGVTTPEYFETYLKNEETAPGVYSALDTENGQLIGPASYMRKVETEEIQKLALLWHSFFSVNESFSGGTYNRNNLVKFDTHVPAGAAVALGGMMYACPTSWYKVAMSYRGLLNSGTWGILHEIGHSHATAYGTVWGMGGSQEGEVRNNALTTLSYIKFCDIGTTRDSNGNVPAEHGFVAHPYSNLKKTLSIAATNPADFNNLEYFNALSIYVNIMHSFGADKFYELMYTYKDNPSFNFKDEAGNTVGNKRSDFIYRLATVYGMDFRSYCNDVYKANVPDGMFSAEQLSLMNSLPVYRPVANLYAGSIDGVKTGGDWRISYGSDVEFDLKSTILTTADGFEIIDVSQPEHGKLTDKGDGKYTYSFNEDYFGNLDSFTFDVKLSDGVCHRFTVTLRISYNGASVDLYGQAESGDLDKEETALQGKEFTTVTQSRAGVVNYKSEYKYETRVSRFWFKADSDGEYAFSATADDKVKVYFGSGFDTLEPKITVNTYTNSFSDANSFTAELKKGKLYAFKIVNLNTGGQGGAALGVKKAGGSYSAVPISRIYPAAFKNITAVREYVYEPKFMISKKDNALNSVINTDKSDWTVVSAPTDIAGGRYVTEQLKDLETGEVIGTIETDKWTYLIDSKTGTTFHTVWGAGATPATEENPDVFIIDTNKVQQFNFFKITAPARSDYCIKSYDLLFSDDGLNYKSVSAADELAYKSGVATVKFPQTQGRFIKLIVKKTSGDNNGAYTVISELDAGISSSTQLIFPSDSGKYFYTGGGSYAEGFCSTKDDSSKRSGLLWAEKKQAKLVIKFKGESVSLYSDVAPEFGSAVIKLDGKIGAEASLSRPQAASRQLIFHAEGLENKEHTVEIITTSNSPFNLDFVGASYNAFLVNASNIYLERGLIIALTVFILLFLAVTAALCLILFVPSVRAKLFAERSKKVKTERPKKVKTAKPKTAKPVKVKSVKPSKKGAAKSASAVKAAGQVYDGDYEDFVEEVPIGDLLDTTVLYQEQQRLKSTAVQQGVFTASAESASAETAAAKSGERQTSSTRTASSKSAAPVNKSKSAVTPAAAKAVQSKASAAKAAPKSATVSSPRQQSKTTAVNKTTTAKSSKPKK